MALHHDADGTDALTLTDFGLPARLAPEAGKAAQ